MSEGDPAGDLSRAPGTPFAQGGRRSQGALATAELADLVFRARRPVTAGGLVFVHGGADMGSGYHDLVHALGEQAGDTVWCFGSRKQSIDYLSGVHVHDNRVIVGRNDGWLHVLDARSGSSVWAFEHGSWMAIPFSIGAALLVTDATGLMRQLDLESARVLREVRVGPGLAVPAVARSRYWLAGKGFVVAYDATSHREIWRNEDEWYSGPVQHTGRSLLVPWGAGVLMMCAESGRILWRHPGEDDPVVHTALDDWTTWTLTRAGALAARETATGRPLPIDVSTRDDPARIRSLALSGSRLVVDSDRGILILDARTAGLLAEVPIAGEACLGSIALHGRRCTVERVESYHRIVSYVDLARASVSWQAEVGSWGMT